MVLLLGGRTGRDGVGGATGSSKEHTEESLETCGSEVQKGNAPEERKLQRLFRRPEVTRAVVASFLWSVTGWSAISLSVLVFGLSVKTNILKHCSWKILPIAQASSACVIIYVLDLLLSLEPLMLTRCCLTSFMLPCLS